jgi:hypothetical protein
MFFTPVITLLASPLPQHDDGRTDLTFLLQLHLPLLLSHIFVFQNPLNFPSPNFRSCPARCDPASRSNPPRPFHPLENPPLSPPSTFTEIHSSRFRSSQESTHLFRAQAVPILIPCVTGGRFPNRAKGCGRSVGLTPVAFAHPPIEFHSLLVWES